MWRSRVHKNVQHDKAYYCGGEVRTHSLVAEMKLIGIQHKVQVGKCVWPGRIYESLVELRFKSIWQVCIATFIRVAGTAKIRISLAYVWPVTYIRVTGIAKIQISAASVYSQ